MATIASELLSGAYYTYWNDLNFCVRTTLFLGADKKISGFFNGMNAKANFLAFQTWILCNIDMVVTKYYSFILL